MADHSMKVVVKAAVDDFRKGMNQVAKEITAAERRFRGFEVVGKRLQNIGKAFTVGVTLPIVGGFAAAGREFTNFEATMSQLEGLVGIAADEVAAFKKEILALGPAVGKAPQELAEALFFITSAGIKGKEAMQVLEMSAKASAAGLGETKTIADLVTSAMNAYGSENLSAAKATDILVAAVREGKAEASELAGSMGQVLPIASEMGVTFDQVGAAIAAMTRTGTDAQNAATQLKNIMASLLKPSKQAEDALAGMGMSAEGLRKQIKEKGLNSALMTIRENTNKFGEDAMAKVFPNIRALMGVLDLMGANAEDNAAIFDALTNSTGALDHAFEVTEATAKHKFNVAMAALKATLVSVGDTVMNDVVPVIEWLSEKLKALAAWWMSLSDETRQFIVRAALLVAAIGPLLIVVGKLISSVKTIAGTVTLLTQGFGKVVGAIGKAIKAVKAAGGVMAWLAANPIVLVIAAIVAAIAIGVLLYKNWDKIADVARRVWTGIVDTIKRAINGIIDGINLLIRGVNLIPGINIPLIGKLELSGAADARKAAGALRDQLEQGETTGLPVPMAKGGIVARPTLALIGEAGPEAVVPLRQMGSMQGVMGLTGGRTSSVTHTFRGEITVRGVDNKNQLIAVTQLLAEDLMANQDRYATNPSARRVFR